MEWSFNLEKAPWWGGLFERLIRSVKRCLRKTVGQAKFSYDEMHTAIVEIEGIINSRPLSYLNSDDTEEPLTPSHLLVGHRLLSLPDNLSWFEHEDEDFEVTSDSLQRRAKHLNNALNHFWRRWSKEYLLELRNSHRQQPIAKQRSPPVEVGEIVVVHDQDHPRGLWKMARVEKTITGRDGMVRGAVVRLPSKNGRPTILQRPLQLLYPLEIRNPPGVTTQTGEEDTTTADRVEVSSPNNLKASTEDEEQQRPQRISAARAQERIRQCLTDLQHDAERVLLTTCR